jgi:hypothetical protein
MALNKGIQRQNQEIPMRYLKIKRTCKQMVVGLRGALAKVDCVPKSEQEFQAVDLTKVYKGMQAGDMFRVVLIPSYKMQRELQPVPREVPNDFPIPFSPYGLPIPIFGY